MGPVLSETQKKTFDLILDEHRVRCSKSNQDHDPKRQDRPAPDTDYNDHDDTDTDVETFLQENLAMDIILAIPRLNTAVNVNSTPRNNESIQLWNFIFGTFLALDSRDGGTNEGSVR